MDIKLPNLDLGNGYKILESISVLGIEMIHCSGCKVDSNSQFVTPFDGTCLDIFFCDGLFWDHEDLTIPGDPYTV